MEDKKKELLDLVTYGAARIEQARQEFIRACTEENNKVKQFFLDNKDELAIPEYILSGRSSSRYYGQKKDNRLLTRNFKFEGYRNGAFYITNHIELNENTINHLEFFQDVEKELYNEITTTSTLQEKLVAAKYAAIIYPTDVDILYFERNHTLEQYTKEHPNKTFSIYIGRLRNPYNDVIDMKKFDEKKMQHVYFTVYPNFIKDLVLFDSDSEFSRYVTRCKLKNAMVTDIDKLPEK